jgi:hypothetical protein
MGDTGVQLELPPYWLIHALTWPPRIDQWSLARAALVWVPSAAGPLPRAARDVRHVAEVYHQVYNGDVVFFSDLDGFLDEEGTSWSERRTDPRVALDQLLSDELNVPSLLLPIGWHAHKILTDSGRASSNQDDDSDAAPIPAWRREAVRRAIALQLVADWPAHIRRLSEEGRLGPPILDGPEGMQLG